MLHPIHINPESELSRQLKEAAAENKPLRLISGEAIYDVEVREQEAEPVPWQHYDPARARQVLSRSAGALRGVDLVELKRDIRDAREQESARRSE
jgi:hypothetical protein